MEPQNIEDILDGLEIHVEVTPDESPLEENVSSPEPPPTIPEKVIANSITDAVTQSNVKVVAESPAMSEAELHQVLGHSTSLTAQNAVNAQNQITTTHQASTTKELRRFLFPLPQKTQRSAFEASLRTLTEIMKTIEKLSCQK